MRVVWLVAVVVATATRSASADGKLTPPPALDPTPLRAAVEADLLWPLTRTPRVEPHLDVLAWYHLWPDTCASTPTRRAPEYVAAYVAAWCVPAEQRMGALVALLDDKRSDHGSMRAAIRSDLVDVVAASDEPDAHAWLGTHHLDSPDVLAALAATELALGKAADWYDTPHAVNDTCHELGLLARTNPATDRWRQQLAAAAAGPHGEVCARVLEAIDCRLVSGRGSTSWTNEADLARDLVDELDACGSLAYRDSRTTAQAKLYATLIAARWPDAERSDAQGAAVGRWLQLARVAGQVRWWGPELEDLAAAAVDNAMTVGGCAHVVVEQARDVAQDLRDKPDRVADRARDVRLDALGDPGRCHH